MQSLTIFRSQINKICHVLRQGVDPLYIRDVLGHASVVTTEIYMGTKSLESKSKALCQIADGIIDDASDIKPLWEEDQDLLNFLITLSKSTK